MTPKISVLSGAGRKRVFGDFVYSDLSGGRIAINPAWLRDNLVACCLTKADGRGADIHTRCHRLVKEPLERAFADLAARGLSKLIHSFDGLWVPRHMTWNPARPLSSHSWGIAFDLNASTNPYGGAVTAENRALNEVFNRYGFAWGGDWNGAKDGMHWELADVEAWKRQTSSPIVSGAQPAPRLILAVAREGVFSYHAVTGALLEDGHFEVETESVANVLGSTTPTPGMTSLRPLLDALDAPIVKVSDHLSDAHDPRYYVFVRPPVMSQVAPS